MHSARRFSSVFDITGLGAMKDVRTTPPVIVVWSEFDEVESTYNFDEQVC